MVHTDLTPKETVAQRESTVNITKQYPTKTLADNMRKTTTRQWRDTKGKHRQD